MENKPQHITRMEAELAELESKIEKGVAVFANLNIELNRTQVHLLNIQLDAMRAYARVLKVRIEYDLNLVALDQLATALTPESQAGE